MGSLGVLLAGCLYIYIYVVCVAGVYADGVIFLMYSQSLGWFQLRYIFLLRMWKAIKFHLFALPSSRRRAPYNTYESTQLAFTSVSRCHRDWSDDQSKLDPRTVAQVRNVFGRRVSIFLWVRNLTATRARSRGPFVHTIDASDVDNELLPTPA